MTDDGVDARSLVKTVRRTYLDVLTGEERTLEHVEPLKRRPGRHPRAPEPFGLNFPEALRRLATVRMTGYDWQVWTYLVGIMGFEEPFRAKTTEIAAATGLRSQHVSRSLGRLRREGLIIPVGRDILLDPHIVWRGSLRSRVEWLARLEKPRQEEPR